MRVVRVREARAPAQAQKSQSRRSLVAVRPGVGTGVGMCGFVSLSRGADRGFDEGVEKIRKTKLGFPDRVTHTELS